jgi:hypothetical protein
MAGRKREARLRAEGPAIPVFHTLNLLQVVDARPWAGHDDREILS